VAGMKPKIICSQCGSVLARNDALCPLCGVTVDWSDAVTGEEVVLPGDVRKKEAHEHTPQRKNISSARTLKTILGVIAVAALVVIAYTLWDEKRPGVQTVQQQLNQQPMNATMLMPPEIQELENSVAADPENMSLTLQLANAYHDRLLYEKAIPYYKTYLVMNPKDADARVDMGICYKEIGKFNEAENEMKTALRYVPNHVNAHFNLGIVYLSEGNYQESTVWFKKTVALDPVGEVGKRAQQLLTQHNSQTTKQE